ncbi:MAG: cation transporter [Pedobacter sp.]|nr:MAG: cation transporter [Pedobacter sp.]
MHSAQQNLRVQKWVAIISVVLLITKVVAYSLTHSVAILTDALESIVNVAAGFIGLYSLYVASKPRDKDHPYGHGKAEFLSAAVEGSLIFVAGLIIMYKAFIQLINPGELERLDLGIWLISVTAVINFLVGYYCVKIGKRNQSLALQASGRHLQTDTISTIGVIAGLIIIYFTQAHWVDAAIAMALGVFIIYTGYTILRESIAGIMDEADEKLLVKMVELLNSNRSKNWVDLHNLRVIKYGSILHIDCHLTVPWYLNVHEAHVEIDRLSELVRMEYGESVELFVHSDGCLPFQCHICNKDSCHVRQQPFEGRVEWTMGNVSQNKKHGLAETI